MHTDLPLLSAFLVGLLGSVHCLGMCGGIVGALTLGLPEATRRSTWSLLPYLLAYNAGRIATYALLGALLGWLAGAAAGAVPLGDARFLGKWISGLFMVALGLYLAGWWPGLVWLERLGGTVWRRIEPFGRRLLPVRNPAQAAGVGLVWGWLPCGMVYAALAFAVTSGSAGGSAARMAVFGLGTLPMMLAVGGAAAWFSGFVRHPLVRATAGLLVIAFGVLMLAMPVPPAGHGRHAAPAAGHLDHAPAIAGHPAR